MSLAKLTIAELALAQAWARGERHAPEGRPAIDAGVIRALLTGADARWSLPPGPVRVSGVTIKGALDLRAVKGRAGGGTIPQFEAYDCTFEAAPDLSFAAIDGLWLIGCTLPALWLTDARIDGRLDLSGCAFGGEKDEKGVVRAIRGDGARIGGHLHLCSCEGDRFTARGATTLVGARIGGQLLASGAVLENPAGFALDAQGARIGGGVFLQLAGGERFDARGGVSLLGAEMASLLAEGARLTAAPGSASALQADGAIVSGEVQLVAAGALVFEAVGEVRFVGARLDELCITGADLSAIPAGDNEVSAGLTCDRAMIAGSVLLRSDGARRFTLVGALRFPGARIGNSFQIISADLKGSVTLVGAAVEGTLRLQDVGIEGGSRGGDTDEGPTCFDLTGLSVRGALEMSDIHRPDGPKTRPVGHYRLDGADVSGLRDDPDTAWPVEGWLSLDGFAYRWIEAPESRSASDRQDPVHKTRLAWLQRQFAPGAGRGRFTPQPYEHLARILREEGRDRDADRVARAKRDMYLKHSLDGFVSRLPVLAMSWLGHGYSRRIAASWMVVWWLVGMIWISIAVYTGGARFAPTHPASGPEREGVAYVAPGLSKGALDLEHVYIRPDGVRPDTLPWPFRAPSRERTRGEAHCPGVILPVYALEVMAPIGDLAQGSDCRLESEGFWGGAWQLWRAAYQLIGAVIFAVLGVALTGLIRKD